MGKKPYSNKKLRFWGIASIGESFIVTVPNTYIAFFLTDVAKLPLGLVSIIMITTSVFDFILAPAAGIIIDTTKPMKLGKLNSWLLICPPIAAVFFLGYFIYFDSQILTAVVVILSAVLSTSFFSNIAYTANLSLISVLATNAKERSSLIAQRLAWFQFGKILIGYISPILIVYFTGISSEKYAYILLMLVCVIVLCIGDYMQFKMAENYENSSVQIASKEKSLSIKEVLHALSGNRDLLITLFVDMSSNIGNNLLVPIAVYYYQYVVGMPSLFSVHMLIAGLGGLLGSYATKFIRFNHRKMLLIIYPCEALCLLIIRYISYNVYVFLAMNLILYFFIGTCQPYELGLYMDNIIYAKWKNGVEATSFIMSLTSIPIKLAQGLKSILIPFILISAGYVAGNVATPELKQSLIDAYTVIPSIISLLAFFALKFLYRLTPEKIESMKAELEKR